MFETHSVRPSRRATFLFSASLHTVIGFLLVVGPLWAVQEPVDPVERIHPFQVTLPKSEEPIRIPEHAVVSPGRAQALGGPARNLKHVEMPASIPALPLLGATGESDPDVEETLGSSQAGTSGLETGPEETDVSGNQEQGLDTIYSSSGPDVVPPVALVTTEPKFPETARRAHMQGDVILEAVIDRDGGVRDARILKSVNPLLDRAAIEAVSTWRYRPALIGARAVAVYLTVRISFHLN